MGRYFTKIVAITFSIWGVTLVMTTQSEAVTSIATVDVSNPATGQLKFAATMSEDAKMSFTPVKLGRSKSGEPFTQSELINGKSKVTLVDTRKNYPRNSEYSLSAIMADGKFIEYGMLSAKMSIILQPQTKDPSIKTISSGILSGEDIELLTIQYLDDGIRDRTATLNPQLEIKEPLLLQLKPGLTVTYGSQITWTLTPKV